MLAADPRFVPTVSVTLSGFVTIERPQLDDASVRAAVFVAPEAVPRLIEQLTAAHQVWVQKQEQKPSGP